MTNLHDAPLVGPEIGQPSTNVPVVPNSGPVGAERPQDERRVLVASSPQPPAQIREVVLVADQWVNVPTSRPVVLVPYSNGSLPAALDHLQVRYSPVRPINNTGVPSGIIAKRGRPYLAQPGDWWVQLVDTVGTPFTVPFMVLDAGEPEFARQLLEPDAAAYIYSGTVTIAPATATELYGLAVALDAVWLRVENVGSNGMTITFGDVIPTATTGFNLPTVAANAANAFLTFERQALPLASLNAFSNLGTDVRWTLGVEGPA